MKKLKWNSFNESYHDEGRLFLISDGLSVSGESKLLLEDDDSISCVTSNKIPYLFWIYVEDILDVSEFITEKKDESRREDTFKQISNEGLPNSNSRCA